MDNFDEMNFTDNHSTDISDYDWFCTVFPKEENSDSLPMDFNSYEEAEAYGKEKYGEGNYVIESPFID